MPAADLDMLTSQWARLGVLFCVEPAGQTPDLERLLLDTVRHAAGKSRLFIMAASWLARYEGFVNVGRLARLIGDELETEHRSTMGLLLDWASSAAEEHRFAQAVEACAPAIAARPLFDIHRRSPAFERLAEMEATPLSKRWGRWMVPTRLRLSAIRPEEWVIAHNPSLVARTPMTP